MVEDYGAFWGLVHVDMYWYGGDDFRYWAAAVGRLVTVDYAF